MTESIRLFGIFCFISVCFGQVPSVIQRIVHQQKVCIYETFRANCGPGRVILIVEALRGRMRNDSGCLSLRPGERPCSADAQLFAERQCSGRRRCSLHPTNDNLKHVNGNCSKYDEKFLDIAYSCEDVYSADDETCAANRPLIVRSRSGHLASVVADETGKGSSVCPWRFDPSPGESVHLTLMDFGVWVDRGDRYRRGICTIYATIRYPSPSSSQTISPDTLVCAGEERQRSVITTTTNLEIRMTNRSSVSVNAAYFLIKFQVFDCPEIKTPPGAEVEKSGGGIRIFCSNERRIHLDLRCVKGFWTPEPNLTCSTTTAGPPPSSPDSQSLCLDYIRSNDESSVESLSSPLRRRVICVNGDTFEVHCSGDGQWIPAQNKTCSSSSRDQTVSASFSWEKYVVPGGLVLLAAVVVIIVVIMCFSRRNRTPKMNELNQRSLDNNSYIAGGSVLRPMSGEYDVLDEFGMQANGSSAPDHPPPHGCSSSYSVCSSPRITQTLPRNDPWSSGSGASLQQRRSDSLPLHRKLPEPHEYTTTLPRDSTYLVPKEDLGGDPHLYDTVKGNI